MPGRGLAVQVAEPTGGILSDDLVFLGVVVGFIVISMFMPLFKMVEMVSQ